VLDFAEHFDIRTSPDGTSWFAVPPYWIRIREPIEDDPLIRACTLTFMSDLGPVPAARPLGTRLEWVSASRPASTTRSGFTARSGPTRGTATKSRVNNSDSRGLVVGGIYDASGSLIASMTQEALWRLSNLPAKSTPGS
jgi:acyl-CoA thioesterase II